MFSLIRFRKIKTAITRYILTVEAHRRRRVMPGRFFPAILSEISARRQL